MLIISQNRTTIVNSNLVASFEADCLGDGKSNTIYANIVNDAPITLGTYALEEDALKIISKIAETEGVVNVFYMPQNEVLNDE